MENTTKVRVEIDIAAQRIVEQVMINNENIKKDLEESVRKAFETIDFDEEINKYIKKCIEKYYAESYFSSKLRNLINSKNTNLLDSHIKKLNDNIEHNILEFIESVEKGLKDESR